jgi:hypothetical protein
MADPTPRTSFDPSRHPGNASTATGPRGRDEAVPERPADSGATVMAGALWIVFPVLLVVAIVVVALLFVAR